MKMDSYYFSELGTLCGAIVWKLDWQIITSESD